MTLKEFSSLVSKETEFTQKEVADVLSAAFDEFNKVIYRGQEISINNFGSFKTAVRKAKKRHDFKTKQMVEVPAKYYVKAKFFELERMLKSKPMFNG